MSWCMARVLSTRAWELEAALALMVTLLLSKDLDSVSPTHPRKSGGKLEATVNVMQLCPEAKGGCCAYTWISRGTQSSAML